ncbi:MEI2-like protein 5 [Prunus dulcis]|uniref:MEI2-like protein 5 n=1 Tax=Prunus dulcis TaxID=3755 RepID=A0A4Y1RKQ6_PRUDU|nr:hypothetical protein Prudu_011121 [Prunus dulcis]BBH04457.1 MEI2-like protein 5 [Prunus dulcis]
MKGLLPIQQYLFKRVVRIRTRSSLILIIQLHQDLKILDDDIDMRTGSLSGTIHVNKRSDLKILDP